MILHIVLNYVRLHRCIDFEALHVEEERVSNDAAVFKLIQAKQSLGQPFRMSFMPHHHRPHESPKQSSPPERLTDPLSNAGLPFWQI